MTRKAVAAKRSACPIAFSGKTAKSEGGEGQEGSHYRAKEVGLNRHIFRDISKGGEKVKNNAGPKGIESDCPTAIRIILKGSKKEEGALKPPMGTPKGGFLFPKRSLQGRRGRGECEAVYAGYSLSVARSRERVKWGGGL